MSHLHSQPLTSGSLPAISEDDSDAFLDPRVPPIPPRSLSRPTPRILAFATPHKHNRERSPPPYGGFGDVGMKEELGQKLAGLREDNTFVSKRGGWRTLAIIAAVVTCTIVGVAIGLGIGLHNKKSSSNGTNGSLGKPAGNSSTNATFPAGTYRFNTLLSSISANCSSNTATWMCYPYTTYAQSPSSSAATFDWIISSSSESPTKHTISSTLNYFSIVFANATLSLQNRGQADEHYFFQTMLEKSTKPTIAFGNQNLASTCYFNQTIFQGFLYTKVNATYGKQMNGPNASSPYPLWPYAVKVEQFANAAANNPACLGPSGESLGDFSVADGSQKCECVYSNTIT